MRYLIRFVALSACLILASCDHFSSVETLITGDWKCDRYDIAFTDAGTYKIVSHYATPSSAWEGKYSVDTSSDKWEGEIKAPGAPHPLSDYRFMKTKPSTLISRFTSFKGLMLYRGTGQDFLQCSRA